MTISIPDLLYPDPLGLDAYIDRLMAGHGFQGKLVAVMMKTSTDALFMLTFLILANAARGEFFDFSYNDLVIFLIMLIPTIGMLASMIISDKGYSTLRWLPLGIAAFFTVPLFLFYVIFEVTLVLVGDAHPLLKMVGLLLFLAVLVNPFFRRKRE